MDFNPNIEMVEIGAIKPYENNAKLHSGEQITKIAAQILKSGWDVPIVLDSDYVIIKGHGRFMAAKQLNLSHAPCIIRRDLNKTQVAAARIADNKVAESPWDEDLLKSELEMLKSSEFDMELTAFSQDDLNKILGSEVIGEPPSQNFTPASGETQPRLDQYNPVMVKCPSCGHDFDARTVQN